ncbi:MAG: phage major capsid protein [Thermoplasmata archaeon]
MTDVNLGLLLSTTLKKYNKTLVDNIHNSHAVYAALKEKGGIKEIDGGERIVQPLMYGKNDTAKSYKGYDTLDTTPQEGIDAAEFNWKQYAVSITISGEEERKNAGRKEKIIDILEARTKQAELSLREKLVEGLFSDGTGNGGKDLTGLKAMVNDSGVYGGIDSATYTWWRSYVNSTAGALSLADMRTAFNTASQGGLDHPNLIVTTQTLFEKYESMATSMIQLNVPTPKDVKTLADLGFQVLQYKGQPIVWDEQCESGKMYFLNLNHMKLVVHKDANFTASDFVKPENQDARIAQILFMGNLTCDRRKSFALLSNKTA